MTISGELFIGEERVSTEESFRAVNTTLAQCIEPAFSTAAATHAAAACELAWSAFDRFRNLDAGLRAGFLEAIAAQILAVGDELLIRAQAESGLASARLTGERARTVGQLRMFADELRRSDWEGVRIDPAIPDRQPVPRPDLRLRRIPVGPVAVFGASNFPLAFSVAGGDTAAALAAGCPVVVKGHPAHPGTGELVAQAIIAAARETNMPNGVFSLLNGRDNALGGALVANSRIKAVAFTGSRAAGLALTKIANARAEPIPVYAEMSSVNPVLLLPTALSDGAKRLGREYVASLTLGVGQFCTNPGLVLAQEGAGLDCFIAAAIGALARVAPGVMLTPGIHRAYQQGVERVARSPGVSLLARGADSDVVHGGRAALFATSAAAFLSNAEIGGEVFGPASMVVRCAGEAELLRVLEQIEGQLTVTLHMTDSDLDLAARLLPVLERKAGRLVVNGWPTGVEVSPAMVHGGPFPATTDGRSSSVGTIAMERFLRPVCYQGFPDVLLPKSLRTR
ncbi:MAG TPA: aldehyde dehydrogenase (NADP(+)) [Steroidobacteraceae bacterium]|nr:aldehyde dehydrogenase (NADP(+)) [Steroidobacteraceae bacterium]